MPSTIAVYRLGENNDDTRHIKQLKGLHKNAVMLSF